MFKEFLKNNIVLLDGAMGTALIDSDIPQGELPELLNLTHPDLIYSIHKSYIGSGSRVIYTNTFGANRLKFSGKNELSGIILSAIKLARKAAGSDNFVALDIGPTGQLLEPLGELSFEEAYDIFKEIVLIAKNEVDLIVVETMASLYEMKAALLAIKENSNLPVIATMTFEENMRTFTGCSPSTFALTATPFADVLGINCSLGPEKILPIMKELKKWTNLPLALKANAGLPDSYGKYNVTAKDFAKSYKKFLKLGVSVVGGCCGTTPEYIKALNGLIPNYQVKTRKALTKSYVSSQTKTVEIVGAQIIGERLNPTGKKAMKTALIEKNYDFLLEQATEQADAGAEILDINVGVPELDESVAMAELVKKVQSVTDLPLQIDSKLPIALESGLRVYCGKAIVNSITAENDVMHKILPIVKKYGASVVALTIDEKGIPETWQERVLMAKKIIDTCLLYGINKNDIYIDCLTLTISTEQAQIFHTLKAITTIKKLYGVKTILGVSNISFGLPERQNINSVFLTMALEAGLDLAILNPNIKANTDVINSFKALKGIDINCNTYITKYSQKPITSLNENIDSIEYSIINGLGRTATLTDKLLETIEPLTVIGDYLMPALDKVGVMFERGELFLPQLIASAESAKKGFDKVKAVMKSSVNKSKGTIVLATVKGDIHDIGKNIVKVLLENYGYKIIDLGKNIDKDIICDCIEAEKVKLVGLSALMTTTADSIRATILEIKKRKLDCKVMIGGAVITQEYADSIGADFYGKDANQSVKYANFVFNK